MPENSTQDERLTGGRCAARGHAFPRYLKGIEVQKRDDTHSIWLCIQVKTDDHHIPIAIAATD